MARTKPPRERAARALCAHEGCEPDIKFEGEPMWKSYLPEVDAVLKAVFSGEEWAEVRSADEG